MMRLAGSTITVLVVVGLVVGLVGCGGEGANVGAAKGYVYELDVGAPGIAVAPPIIISPFAIPPEGYVPAIGAVVTLGEELAITNSLGFYVLQDLPPGEYELEVDIDDDGVVDIAVTITIIAGETTWGTGHTEGG
ncbi:MAG: hypothetical protein KAW89_05395 [Armatimonadetes bacterium]|nr:hypothetical protein [Armatimonadota bacterium]